MDKPVDIPAPPAAEQRPYSYERHGVTIEDPWHWLRDPKYPEVDDPDVLAYLHAENEYFEHWEKQHRALIDALFEEMKGRIKEDDPSVPIRDGDFLYWWAFRPGAQYRTWYRRPADGGDDQIIFDEPVEAEGKEYFRLGALEPSPDGRLLAILIDDNGSERFHLRIRDVATGKDVETVTEVGIGQPVWTSDSAGIVFTEVNENWRSYRARYHRLGSRPDEAVTLYEETEELGFSVGVGRSHDRSLIIVSTGDNATSEVRFVSAERPVAAADAHLAAQAQPRISCRRRAREIVDPHQRRPCELPHRRGRPGEPRRVADGDRRVRPRLSHRAHRLSRPSRDQQPGRRPRSAGAAHLRGRGRADPVPGGELQRLLPRQSRVRARQLPARLFVDGHADDDLRLSSGHPASSRSGRSRRSRRATMRRNMRPSG